MWNQMSQIRKYTPIHIRVHTKKNTRDINKMADNLWGEGESQLGGSFQFSVHFFSQRNLAKISGNKAKHRCWLNAKKVFGIWMCISVCVCVCVWVCVCVRVSTNSYLCLLIIERRMYRWGHFAIKKRLRHNWVFKSFSCARSVACTHTHTHVHMYISISGIFSMAKYRISLNDAQILSSLLYRSGKTTRSFAHSSFDRCRSSVFSDSARQPSWPWGGSGGMKRSQERSLICFSFKCTRVPQRSSFLRGRVWNKSCYLHIHL